jgi:hypothetical protein
MEVSTANWNMQPSGSNFILSVSLAVAKRTNEGMQRAPSKQFDFKFSCC